MKFTTVIDKDREEEVVVYLRERREIADRIAALVSSESASFVGYSDSGIIPLLPADIFCFTLENGRLYALTETDRLLIKQRLCGVEEKLGAGFIKINQSCIINADKIERFDVSIGGAMRVTLKNGFRDCISRRQLKLVRERIGFKI